MKERTLHILSHKTLRGAALAVASYSVVSSSFALADGAIPPETQGAYSVDSASDTLAAILKDAQEKGFVRTKDEEVDISKKENVPATTPVSPVDVKEDIKPFTCKNSTGLDFSDLQGFETYEDLTAVKAKYNPEDKLGDAENLARAYIALGLGDEALVTLHADTSAEGQILKQVAQIIAYPQRRPANQILSEYKDCNTTASFWAFLEDPTQFSVPFNMTEIRDMIYTLDDFPAVLKERLMISLAIASAETGQNNFTNYLLERLENQVMEEGRPLPKDRKSDFEYLYLTALLQKNSNPTAAVSKFNFLSERGSVYRAKSVKYMAEIKSDGGENLGNTLEADLEDVSARLKETAGSQEAAYQLIKGQLQQGRINDSIHSTKSFLKEGSEEYKLAQDKISTVLMAHFQSERLAIQSMALDTLLKQSDFLKDAPRWEDLKSGAFAASLDLDLPELISAIQTDGDTLNSNQKQSLEKARLLLALKAKTFKTSDYANLSPAVLKGLEKNIMEYAMMNSNLGLAKLALNDMGTEEEKAPYAMNLAWLEQDWSKAHNLSLHQVDKANGKAASDNQPLKPKYEPSILTVLAKPALSVPSLKGSKWRKDLSAELSEMENQIKISKAFLNHG